MFYPRYINRARVCRHVDRKDGARVFVNARVHNIYYIIILYARANGISSSIALLYDIVVWYLCILKSSTRVYKYIHTYELDLLSRNLWIIVIIIVDATNNVRDTRTGSRARLIRDVSFGRACLTHVALEWYNAFQTRRYGAAHELRWWFESFV